VFDRLCRCTSGWRLRRGRVDVDSHGDEEDCQGRHQRKRDRDRTTTSGSAGDTSATNLVVTPRVRIQLRSAVTNGDTAAEAAKVKGPLPGRTYYAEYQGYRYALATFSFPVTGTQDQPLLFVQLPGIPYLVAVSDTGGDPGQMSAIPCAVRKVWNLGCS
jgi:hypothetical protein